MSRRVAIYGGGVAGLSAAQELRERGFEVDIYEASDDIGGKARSQFLPGTGSEGRLDLPGEHGFRFFPAFYRHLDDTMDRIPSGDGGTVLDNLLGSHQFAVARQGTPFAQADRRLRGEGVHTLAGALRLLQLWLDRDALALSLDDLASFMGALSKFLTSGETRRQSHCEQLSFYDYVQAGEQSDNYRRLMSSLPRTMVAMDGRHGSAYTIGKVAAQLFIFDAVRPGKRLDRVLNGPTTLRWLNPWRRYLEGLGVRIHMHSPLKRLLIEGGRVRAGVVVRNGQDSAIEADFHICAVPIEQMRGAIIDQALAEACPGLQRMRDEMHRPVGWMVGAQYYLRRDVEVCDGHVIYTDSPWALSSISQPQFWRFGDRRKFAEVYGDGNVHGLLSVDISDWFTEAPRLQRQACQSSREEILDEVFAQVVDGLAHSPGAQLSPDDVIARHLDSNIVFGPQSDPRRTCHNTTPLLIHQPGHWQLRPDAQTELPNLLLASDYVATHTNLASMEGANEAARRAVRYILTATGQDGDLPELFELEEPDFLTPFKALDDLVWEASARRKHVFELQDEERLQLLRSARHKSLPLKEISESLRGAGELRTRSGESIELAGLTGLQQSVDAVLAET